MELVHRLVVGFAAQIDNSRANIPQPDLDGKFAFISSLVFGILGGIAFLYIIFGGIKMITSQGTPEGFVKARNTIIYASLGLVICISAFVIVNFVIGKVG